MHHELWDGWNRRTSNKTSSITTHSNTTTNNKSKEFIVILHVQGLCESMEKICGKCGIQIYFKGNRAIKNILEITKDNDLI